jgi:hypothetical protein
MHDFAGELLASAGSLPASIVTPPNFDFVSLNQGIVLPEQGSTFGAASQSGVIKYGTNLQPAIYAGLHGVMQSRRQKCLMGAEPAIQTSGSLILNLLPSCEPLHKLCQSGWQGEPRSDRRQPVIALPAIEGHWGPATDPA